MTKKILYGVGLLITFLMILGLAINWLGLAIGVSRPLNSFVILLTFWFSVFVVVIINKQRIWSWLKSFKNPPLSVYLLILLPVTAVGGAELVNYSGSNALLMVLLALIVVIPIVCMFTKVIPEKYWAFTVWIMALSVVLHTTLVSSNLWGTDNIIEYGCYRVTALAGYWNHSFNNVILTDYNSTLSITILPLMLSKITFTSGLWIFKLVFPILLSLLPVATYELVKTQFNNKIAFMSAFFTMSVYIFFTEALFTDKELVAIVLLSIFLLMTLDNIKYKSYLLVILGIGIIASHYSVAFMFLVVMGMASLLLRSKRMIALTGILVLITGIWYLTQGNGMLIRNFVDRGQVIAGQVPVSSSGGVTVQTQNWVVRLFSQGRGFLPLSLLVVYVVTQLLIVAGFVKVLWGRFVKKETQISVWFIYLAVSFVILLGAELLIPNISVVISLNRIYLISMVVLSPFIILGAMLLFKKKAVALTTLIAVLFFLMNTGFIYELTGHPLSNAVGLNQNLDYPVYTDKEIDGAKWLVAQNLSNMLFYDNMSYYIFVHAEVEAPILTGKIGGNLFLYNPAQPNVVNNIIPIGSVIYLRRYNLINDEISLQYNSSAIWNWETIPIQSIPQMSQLINTGEVLFDNGDCRIIKTTIAYGEKG
jgi:uncharacterized membrane protein